MRATEDLKNEHEGIKIMLRICKTISGKIQRGEQIHKEHFDSILEFLTVFVDMCHHGKEEEFLFPVLEKAGISREGGPIGVLLQEHEQGRKLLSRFNNAMNDYSSGDKTSITIISTILDEYTSLMTQHIDKENRVLFTTADAKLNTVQDDELLEAFERLEKERIGQGKHEAFHKLLNELKNIYLN